MTDESPSANSPNAATDRSEARRLFAAAQECSAAAEYEEAMRLLKRIPKAHRGSDHERIAKQVRTRFEEIDELTENILAAMKKSKSPEILLPLVRRLVELKPGDEWANDLRHRLEAQQQDELPSRSRFGLGFGKPGRLEPQPLEELPEESAEEEIENDGDEIEDWDEAEPIELIPVGPPALPRSARTNGERPQRARRRDAHGTGDAQREHPQRSKSKPPPLPLDYAEEDGDEEDDDDGPSNTLRFVMFILLFILLAVISVVIGVMLAKGPRGLLASTPKHAAQVIQIEIDSQHPEKTKAPPATNVPARLSFASVTPQAADRQLATLAGQQMQSLTKTGVVGNAS